MISKGGGGPGKGVRESCGHRVTVISDRGGGQVSVAFLLQVALAVSIGAP